MGYQWWVFFREKSAFILPNFFPVLVDPPPGHCQAALQECAHTWYLKTFTVHNRLLSFLSIEYLSGASNYLVGRGRWRSYTPAH